jgi:hypothetical protein
VRAEEPAAARQAAGGTVGGFYNWSIRQGDIFLKLLIYMNINNSGIKIAGVFQPDSVVGRSI